MWKKEKLEKLGQNIQEATSALEREKSVGGNKVVATSGFSLGCQVSTELAISVLVGAALGWFLDSLGQTRPIFFLTLLFLGCISGVVNAYRVARSFRAPIGLVSYLSFTKGMSSYSQPEEEQFQSLKCSKH